MQENNKIISNDTLIESAKNFKKKKN